MNVVAQTSSAAMFSALRNALTFYASFDNGPDADFALGDRAIYHADFPLYAVPGVYPALTEGLGSPAPTLAAGRDGKGSALSFSRDNSRVVCFRAEGNVAWSPALFRGSASFWISADPAAIPQHYADPFQITDKDYNNDCIWVDFTKNDTPSDFRLGVFGDQSVWDPKNLHNLSEEFFWRLMKVPEPPFAAGTWTHVVVIWDDINTAGGGRAVMYLNGVLRGKTGRVSEAFRWNIAEATIRLGTGPFVGLIDDLALFNRPLLSEEVTGLFEADVGASSLLVG